MMVKGSEVPLIEGRSTKPSCTVIPVKDRPTGDTVKVNPLCEQAPTDGVQLTLLTPKLEGTVIVRLVREASKVAPMAKGELRVMVRLDASLMAIWSSLLTVAEVRVVWVKEVEALGLFSIAKLPLLKKEVSKETEVELMS